MAPSVLSIRKHFAGLRDPRLNRRKRHLLADILTIAVCAVIAGANNFPQIEAFGKRRRDWLARFLALPNGIPSHDTFERLFQRLCPDAFQRCFLGWLRALHARLGGDHFAIDGKTLRHSGSPANGLGPLHLVSVWATQANLTLGQVAVDAKSNEITAIPRLLELLDLHGALVTLDAMGCQKEIARQITEGGGDYVLTVKENQGHLYADILDCFVRAIEADFAGVPHDRYEAEERGHGRHERRCYEVIYDPQGLRDEQAWAGLCVVGHCYSERTVGGQTSCEGRYFIGSRRASAREYGQALRGHWRIENNLHWQLDVTFREDDSRIRDRNAAENFALLRRVALSLLKRHPGKGSLATKRYTATLDEGFLEEVVQGVILGNP
jgi:predicted transposase YbfD/YdcC